MKISISKIRNLLFMLLIVGIPLHVVFFRIFPIPNLYIWRDLAIIVLIVLGTRKKKMCSIEIELILMTCLGLIFVILYHGETNTVTWLSVFRLYMIPNLVFIAAKHANVTTQKRLAYFSLYIYIACIISLFGVFQMFFWQEGFRKIMGLGYASVLLSSGFQRNIGVFESANTMGVYIAFAIIILLSKQELIKNQFLRRICITILFISLLLTFSFSSYIAVAIVLLVKYLRIHIKTVNRVSLAKQIMVVFCALIVIIITLSSNGKVVTTIKEQIQEKAVEISMAIQLSGDRIEGNSASKHLDDFTKGIQLVLENPNGLGFAQQSFMVNGRVNYSIIGNQESSYFTVLYDWGVILGCLYFLPFVFILLDKRICINSGDVSKILMCILMITFMFLPLIQVYDLRLYVFMFAGLEYGKDKDKVVCEIHQI